MKRLAWNGVKMGTIALAAMILSGCVSRAMYDELKFAQRNCEAERERLKAELAGAQNTIAEQDREIRRLKDLLANRESIIAGLKEQLAGTGKYMKGMEDIYRKLADQRLANLGAPLRTPLPVPLSNALEEFARKYPTLVEYDKTRGVLRFKSDVVFDLGSDQVKADIIPALQEFAKILLIPDAANFDAVVVGHTDNIPIKRAQTLQQHKSNWHLSVHRAISVMTILREAGINPERLGVMGYGEFRPIAPNNGTRGNAKNRRVEIYIVPKQAVGNQSVSPSGGAAPSEAAPPAALPAPSKSDEAAPGGMNDEEETAPSEK